MLLGAGTDKENYCLVLAVIITGEKLLASIIFKDSILKKQVSFFLSTFLKIKVGIIKLKQIS